MPLATSKRPLRNTPMQDNRNSTLRAVQGYVHDVWLHILCHRYKDRKAAGYIAGLGYKLKSAHSCARRTYLRPGSPEHCHQVTVGLPCECSWRSSAHEKSDHSSHVHSYINIWKCWLAQNKLMHPSTCDAQRLLFGNKMWHSSWWRKTLIHSYANDWESDFQESQLQDIWSNGIEVWFHYVSSKEKPLMLSSCQSVPKGHPIWSAGPLPGESPEQDSAPWLQGVFD